MVVQEKFLIQTNGRGTMNITPQITSVVTTAQIACGICHIFVHHTSASLILCENADPVVRQDLERFMLNLVPDGDDQFDHVDEGPDDMPAHVRTILTNSELSVPISGGRCQLGTWQGIYLWEHRTRGHSRQLTVTVIGE